MIFRFIVFAICAIVAHSKDPSPILGPYETACKTYEYSGMDSSDHTIDVHYPSNPKATEKFPFISFVHGYGGGGEADLPGYYQLLDMMAAFGYVIASPRACNVGCHDDAASLPSDPPGFAHFYMQQFKAIEWGKKLSSSGDPVLGLANFSKGVGISGHSMGGQATLFSSSAENVTDYDIKAAVLMHPYTHTYPPPKVPFIVFTGAKDHVAPAHPMADNIFNASGAYKSRGIANKESADHLEPCYLHFNNILPQFAVAWFKIYLDETPTAFGFDFKEMLFGKGTDSLCGGGDGNMTQCNLIP